MDQATLNSLRLKDQKALKTLLTALNGAQNSLRRDECGDPTIQGSRGTIQSVNGKFHVYIPSVSAMAWTWAKKQLVTFATPHQDGDAEGILILMRMPDRGEAKTLRHLIGLRQTVSVPPYRAQSLKKHAH